MRKMLTTIMLAFVLAAASSTLALAAAPDWHSIFTSEKYNKTFTDENGIQHEYKCYMVTEGWNEVGKVYFTVYYHDIVITKVSDTEITTDYGEKRDRLDYKDACPVYPNAPKYSYYQVIHYADHDEVVVDYRSSIPKETTAATSIATAMATAKATPKATSKPTVKATPKPTAKATHKTVDTPHPTIKATPIPAPSNVASATSVTPVPTATPAPNVTPTPSPAPTATPTPIAAAAATASPSAQLTTASPSPAISATAMEVPVNTTPAQPSSPVVIGGALFLVVLVAGGVIAMSRIRRK